MLQQIENTQNPWLEVPVLTGDKLRLEPLSEKHVPSLVENLLYANSWHGQHWGITTEEGVRRLIQMAEARKQAGTGKAYAMVVAATNQAVGISRFMYYDKSNNGVEIGGTWIGIKWQKTFVNTEAKLLMLAHAFEYMKVQRVEFRVDSLNFNSQRGVLRIGAKYEGELRQKSLLPDGRKRDYKVYSIIDTEWNNVQQTLKWYLKKYV